MTTRYHVPVHSLSPPTTPDPPPDLAAEISHFRGNVYRYFIALLRDPDVNDSTIAHSLGLASDTPAAWLYLHPGFRELRQRIRDARDSTRTEYARAAMMAAVPDAVDTMIAVAKDPKARDGQRARERILEETGALKPAGAAKGEIDRIDLVAARIFYKAKEQPRLLGPSEAAPQIVEGSSST